MTPHALLWVLALFALWNSLLFSFNIQYNRLSLGNPPFSKNIFRIPVHRQLFPRSSKQQLSVIRYNGYNYKRNSGSDMCNRKIALTATSFDDSSVSDLVSAAEQVGRLNLDRNGYQTSVDASGEEDRDFDFMGEDMQREIFHALKLLRRESKDDINDILDLSSDEFRYAKSPDDADDLVSKTLSKDYSAKEEIELMRQLDVSRGDNFFNDLKPRIQQCIKEGDAATLDNWLRLMLMGMQRNSQDDDDNSDNPFHNAVDNAVKRALADIGLTPGPKDESIFDHFDDLYCDLYNGTIVYNPMKWVVKSYRRTHDFLDRIKKGFRTRKRVDSACGISLSGATALSIYKWPSLRFSLVFFPVFNILSWVSLFGRSVMKVENSADKSSLARASLVDVASCSAISAVASGFLCSTVIPARDVWWETMQDFLNIWTLGTVISSSLLRSSFTPEQNATALEFALNNNPEWERFEDFIDLLNNESPNKEFLADNIIFDEDSLNTTSLETINAANSSLSKDQSIVEEDYWNDSTKQLETMTEKLRSSGSNPIAEDFAALLESTHAANNPYRNSESASIPPATLRIAPSAAFKNADNVPEKDPFEFEYLESFWTRPEEPIAEIIPKSRKEKLERYQIHSKFFDRTKNIPYRDGDHSMITSKDARFLYLSEDDESEDILEGEMQIESEEVDEEENGEVQDSSNRMKSLLDLSDESEDHFDSMELGGADGGKQPSDDAYLDDDDDELDAYSLKEYDEDDIS